MQRDEPLKIARITDDCLAAVIRDFLNSPKFRAYSDSTRTSWGRELNFLSAPERLGAVTLDKIRPALVQAYMDGLEGLPGKQATALSALKQLEKWAVVRDLLPRSITLGVEIEESDGGHVPWTDDQVALAEKHARPDLARAVTLGANTGQRGSDLIRMGWTDIQVFKGTEGIHVVQKKTGREVWVPIVSTLAAAMATWERQPGPFLRRLSGAAWNRHDLSNTWTRERDSNPALRPLKEAGLVIHGLRGHACVRLLRAGANTRQIADMVGMSEPVVARYTRFSSQQENASAAVFHMERTLREHKFGVSQKSSG